ncbi:hypothetical protein L1887_11050 [Cichorium endivia]|nr:hypothetical protein L1887_11050 [Cichorium endivia]
MPSSSSNTPDDEVKKRQPELNAKLQADREASTGTDEEKRLADATAAEQVAKEAEEKLKAQTKVQQLKIKEIKD